MSVIAAVPRRSSRARLRIRALATGLLFISPWLVGFGLFLAYPIAMSFYYSLSDFSVLREPVFVGLRNYETLVQDDVFKQALGNTLWYAAWAIPLGILMSLTVAMLLNTGVGGMPAYRTFFFLPSLVPAVATALIWQWIFNGKEGLINLTIRIAAEHLGWLLLGVAALVLLVLGVGWTERPADRRRAALCAAAGGTLGAIWLVMGMLGRGGFGFSPSPPNWLQNADLVKPVLVLVSLWGTGHAVVIYLAGLQDVPVHLYEAADLDGATWRQKIRHVTLPMLSPVILFNGVMAIIGTFNFFAIPFVMTPGGQPARSSYFLAVNLYDNAFTYLRMGYASAMAWVLFLIVFLLTMAAMKLSARHVHYGD